LSYAIDANLLLYASDSNAPQRAAAERFFEAAAENEEELCIPYPVAVAYLRIATHPRIFSVPLAPEVALRNLESLADLPHVRFLSEREGFLSDYRAVAASLEARGNLVTDIHIATILRQHGVRVIYTSDRDFLRFPFLQVRDPLAG
jgi:toxin-antitoxin system PIN domain toxin